MPHYIPTCETAVSTVPEWHRDAFKGIEDRATSTDGWSPGALNLAQGIAMHLHAPLLHAEMTRLLIDLSCHPSDESRWSDVSRKLTPDQREKLDRRSKRSYLDALGIRIETPLKRNETPIHLTVDTSTKLPDGTVSFELDSRREIESNCVLRWADALKAALPEIKITRTAPPSRGLSSYLREIYPTLGSIKLSVSQSAFLTGSPIPWVKLKKALIGSIPRD